MSRLIPSSHVLMDNKFGMHMLDGGYMHHVLLKAAQFKLQT